MEEVWISLGSNLGDRAGHLRLAAAALDALGEVTALSGVYETEPVGFAGQPWFLNAVAGLRVSDEESPERLLRELLAVERAMGRQRGGAGEIAKGPRIIDLDILLYGSRVVNSQGLQIPHPEMHRRRFVLEPLAEVAPEAVHPLLRRSVLVLLRELPAGGPVVRRLAPLSLREE